MLIYIYFMKNNCFPKLKKVSNVTLIFTFVQFLLMCGFYSEILESFVFSLLYHMYPLELSYTLTME